MSVGGSLSIASVEGLIASVGESLPFRSHCHAGPTSGTGRRYYHSNPVIDLYLDHLRVERRLGRSHARELRTRFGRSGRFLGHLEPPAPESLDRAALEAFVRQRVASGLSRDPWLVKWRRSAVSYRFLVARPPPAGKSRGRFAAASCVARAAEISLHGRSGLADRSARCLDAARSARSRDD